MNLTNAITHKCHNARLYKEERRHLYRSLASLVIPITVQNLIGSLVNSADIFMLGFINQDALSAVSLANQYYFILVGVFFGISSGITILCSQYWGKKDLDSIQAVMGIALKLSVAITAVLTAMTTLFPVMMMKVYTDNALLIEIGASYLRIAGFSYHLSSFSQVYLSMLKSVEQAKISTCISCLSLFLNVGLNAAFIFGIAGFPKLGVIGVAIATLIARFIESLICVLHYLSGKVMKPKLSILFSKNRLLFKDFLKYSIPALINDCVWTLAFSTYSIILGHMTSDVVAASSVAETLRNLFTVLCFGLSAGGSVILGKEIGAKQMDLAKRDAARLCRITLVISILTGLLILLVKNPLMNLYSLTNTARDYLNTMMIISSYYIVGQAMNTLTIAGIFRAGGDSRFGMICDTIDMWLISVPLGFISAYVLKLPPMVVYFILCLDEFWKIPAVYIHYKSYKWLKNITREFS